MGGAGPGGSHEGQDGANSDDAFLAYDRNGNGTIDNGSELFGQASPIENGSTITSQNGLEALKFLQRPSYGPSQLDSIIDVHDAAFAHLLLWTDVNHNGISEPDEIQSAAAAGLVSIGTDYRERRRTDQNGNWFRLTGESDWLNAQGKVKKEPVWDVWLRTR